MFKKYQQQVGYYTLDYETSTFKFLQIETYFWIVSELLIHEVLL